MTPEQKQLYNRLGEIFPRGYVTHEELGMPTPVVESPIRIWNQCSLKDGILEKFIVMFWEYLTKETRTDMSNYPNIWLLDDEANAASPLATTAHYDPQMHKISVYTTGRHIKDILRSISHEMIHHLQNLDGRLTAQLDTGEGYAQKNPYMRRLEEEAFLKGNMYFRDFEDSIKYNSQLVTEMKQKIIGGEGDEKEPKDFKNAYETIAKMKDYMSMLDYEGGLMSENKQPAKKDEQKKPEKFNPNKQYREDLQDRLIEKYTKPKK